MTEPNLHDLINIKGAGNAEKELKKQGHWDEYAGLEYVDWQVKADVVVREDDHHVVTVSARSEEEAEKKAMVELQSDFCVIEVEDITEVKELK